MPVDFIKAISEDQTYVRGLLSYAEKHLQPHRPQNKNYICFSNGSGRFRFEFRKVIFGGELIGYRNVEVCFSPHYIFNNDLHNGNKFTPSDAIKTIKETFLKIGVLESEMQDFKVTSLEYGLNLNTGLKIENLIDGILYTQRKPFIVPDTKQQYFKISNTTPYKRLKAYAKGIQFLETPEYGIDRNIFRFEVKSKQSKNVRKLGINSVADLLKPQVYSALFQSILDEWENVLIINLEQKDEVNTPEYWQKALTDKYRHQFRIKREKYYENLDKEDNLHHLIKCKIIDKIVELQNCTNSTHETYINKGKNVFNNIPPLLINVESVQSSNTDEVELRGP
ncbi:hypothetical protein [Kaistella sp.]|uniref:hypothetical protein n=1 Tax=Kaistella sp. TaxID=2782235 RepID=UPI0035A18FB5